MSAWRYVVPNSGMGEKIVPAPKTAFLLGEPSGQVVVKATGTWIHEEDWPYLQSLKFPCRGVMRDGFAVGCPDANQFALKPPEPPIEPPPAFFEIPPAFEEEIMALEPPEDDNVSYSRRKRRERS